MRAATTQERRLIEQICYILLHDWEGKTLTNPNSMGPMPVQISEIFRLVNRRVLMEHSIEIAMNIIKMIEMDIQISEISD